MTGPEHYYQAEAEHELAAKAADAGQDETWKYHMASAQVHATLALAASYAEVNPTSMWLAVAGPPEVTP